MDDATSFSPYGTHIPVLAAAVAMARSGPVLELGAGEFSTALLHAVCAATNRRLVTIDHDPNWVARFAAYRSENHRVETMSWDNIPSEQWAVVFIDHAPAERRKIDIENLRERCELMVIHDTEDYRYEYTDALFGKFTYRIDYKRLVPWTTILSMTRDLSALTDF